LIRTPLLDQTFLSLTSIQAHMEVDDSEPAGGSSEVNPQMQILGKIINYGLMFLGVVGIVYFIAAGSILGIS